MVNRVKSRKAHLDNLSAELMCGIFYVIAGAIGWIFYLSPKSVKQTLQRFLIKLLQLSRYRKKIIEDNLLRAFGPVALLENNKLLLNNKLQQFYDHLSCVVFEVFYLFGPMPFFCKKSVTFSGYEFYEQAKETKRPILFLASHLGNWEVMTAKACLDGMPILMVTKHLKPEWLHLAFERARARCGVQATYEPHTMRDVLLHLRSPGNAVGIILDQYMGPPFSVRVPFFGTPVGTSAAFATIAKRMNAVILPCGNRRKESGEFEVFICPPLDYSVEDSIEKLTGKCTLFIEKQIRNNPDQWLWSHRRFKGDLSLLDKAT